MQSFYRLNIWSSHGLCNLLMILLRVENVDEKNVSKDHNVRLQCRRGPYK